MLQILKFCRMKSLRILQSSEDNAGETWTITAHFSGAVDLDLTVVGGRAFDATIAGDSFTLDRTGVFEPLTITPESASLLCLQELPQVLPIAEGSLPVCFAVFVFFWAWFTAKILP